MVPAFQAKNIARVSKIILVERLPLTLCSGAASWVGSPVTLGGRRSWWDPPAAGGGLCSSATGDFCTRWDQEKAGLDVGRGWESQSLLTALLCSLKHLEEKQG